MNAGLYQAPWANGTYHVVATSVADPNQMAVATISVSAKFAFIEKLLNGIDLLDLGPRRWTALGALGITFTASLWPQT